MTKTCRRILATALIAVQTLVPTYASSADSTYFFRYESGLEGTSGENGGGGAIIGKIPELSLAAITGNVAGTAIASTSPTSSLASIRDRLVGGENAVVFESAAPSIPGISFDLGTGIMSGTATAEFNGTVVITYRDAAARVGKINVPVSIYPKPILASTQDSYDLPQNADAAGHGIRVFPANNGFYNGVVYSLAPGSQPLPAGLALADGVISGTANAAPGTYPITLRASSTTDAAIYAEKTITLNIIAASGLSVINFGGGNQALAQFTSEPTLESAVRIAASNEPYSEGDLTWALVSGTLPPGITTEISEDTSVLKYVGYASEQGTWDNIVWSATNADGKQVLTPAATFTVGPRSDIALAADPSATVHVDDGGDVALAVHASSTAYGQTLAADDWSVTGDLPPGVSYAANGNTLVFSGTASEIGLYHVTVAAADALGSTGTVNLTFDVSVSFFAVNNNDNDETLAQYTSQPTVGTAVRDRNSNEAYSGTLTWTLVSGSLPPGITTQLSPGTDVLSYVGYPTEQGTWPNIVWLVKDVNGNQITTPRIDLKVGPRDALALTADNGGVANLENGETLSMAVTATNAAFGTLDASNWNVSGTLPEGVTYAVQNKVLTFSGSPKKTGRYDVVVAATDSVSGNASTTVTFNVSSFMNSFNLGGSDQVLTQSTSQPTVSTWARIKVSNESYHEGTWALVSGSLPPGISSAVVADSSRVAYSGYPTEQGTWSNIVWSITDPDGNSILTEPVSFTVGPRAALALTASSAGLALDNGASVSATVTATNIANGPSAQLDWSVNGLPPGVTYSTENGVLTFGGSPSRTGTYAAVVSATDSLGGTASTTVTFTVSSFMASFNLGGNNQVLTQYTSQPTASTWARIKVSNEKYTGGTWAMASGTLPPGITSSISADNSVLSYSGYPTQQGTWSNIVWSITDPNGNSIVTDPVSFAVGPRAALALATNPANGTYATRNGLGIGEGALTVTASSLPYGAALTASDWTVTGLPDGVSYAVNGNVLSFTGTPVATGEYTITVKATDSLGGTATKTIAFKVGVNMSALYFAGTSQTLMQYVDQPTMWANIRVAASNTAYRGGATYSLASGTLPAGVTVDGAADGSSAFFTGYPTEVGTFDNLVIAVTDPYGNVFNTKPFSMTVTPRTPLALTAMPGTTRTMQQNTDDAMLTVSPTNLAFGTPIPTSGWTVTGTVPPGVTYAATANGLLFSGKGTTAGTYNVHVVGIDSTASSASVDLTFRVTAVAPTYSVTNYSIGTTVANTQSVMFGSAPTLTTQAKLKSNSTLYTGVVSWALAAGKLPPGVTAVVSTDKSTISYAGAPTEMGTFGNIVWMATDSTGAQVASAPITFIVNGPITQLSANWYSTCGVTSDGSAKCWGRNDSAAVGDGTTADKLVPTQVQTLTSDVQQIATGKNHACAVISDGTVKCWGTNNVGQLGNGLIGNGTSSSFKYGAPTPATQFGTNNRMVSTGDSVTCVLKNSGGVLCVGANTYGQLGNNSLTNSVTAVTPVGLSTGVASISVGTNTTCAAMTDGTAKCWGTNRFGQVGDATNVNKQVPTTVSGLTGVKNVMTHSYINDFGTTCATTDHGIFCWGNGQYGQIGNGVMSSRNTPAPVTGMESGIDVQIGVAHVCGQKADKTVWCWGGDAQGRLGDGMTTNRAQITIPVINLGPVETLAAGGDHTCATNAAGLTRCWGAGAYGALGSGTVTDQLTAVPISY